MCAAPVCDTLDEYRLRYAQTKADTELQAAHAAAPWIVVFDDHEVANNWNAQNTSLIPINRKAAGFQVWYENMPVRRCRSPTGR